MMDLDHPILAGYSHMDESDLPADPEAEHMGPTDHFNPVQFADQLQPSQSQLGEIPAVHGPLKTSYYGQGDSDELPR